MTKLTLLKTDQMQGRTLGGISVYYYLEAIGLHWWFTKTYRMEGRHQS